MYRNVFYVCIFAHVFTCVKGCGIVTHMLIGARSKEYFLSKGQAVDYHELIRRHQDALQAGSVFPDSFYSNLCYGGNYSQVSDDIHWTRFLNVSINYIRNKHPQPWDEATEKLVVFLFGIMSHQISDAVWHGIGIEQGFVQALAAVDFHGNYSTASKAADFGGDIAAIFNMDAIGITDSTDEWYVPTEDLYNIFKEYYGTVKLDKDAIDTCSTLLVLESLGELYGIPELFSVVAETSPFLVNHMEDYFLGGVNDMIGWSHRMWENGVTLLEKGLSSCSLPHNPLFIRCDNSTTSQGEYTPPQNYVPHHIEHGLIIDDLHVQTEERGITIKPKYYIKNTINLKKNIRIEKKQKKNHEPTSGAWAVNSSCAKLGWSLAAGDMDKDGYEDIVVGAPGYSVMGSQQQGRVYIVYGNSSDSGGFAFDDINLDFGGRFNNMQLTVIDGFSKKQSRFGSGIAVLDLNLDGILDLAIGAPSYWINSPLEYKGLISIYFGKQNVRSYGLADLTISCQSLYCNLGYNLKAGDVDGDGHNDLIMGLPFFSATFNQSGLVAALISSKTFSGSKTIPFESIKWRVHPQTEQPFSWFGYNIVAKAQVLIVSSPNVRKCANPNCSYSTHDIQETGRADIFNFGKIYKIKNATIHGTMNHEAAGYSVDFGFLYGGDALILAISHPGMTVQGSYWTLPVNLTRAGSVFLYNITAEKPYEVARFDGNRRYGGFGFFVKIQDVNGDGIQDLMIGEPFKNVMKAEVVNADHGQVYIYYGGYMFPRGNATFTEKCTFTKPCPDKVADIRTGSDDTFAGNNGHNAEILYEGNEKFILFTSDIRSRYISGVNSGAVHHYYINNL